MNNKKWNKILTSTIVLTTVFSPMTVSANTSTGSQVVTSSQDAIAQARELGLLVGDPNGDLRPSGRLMRVEVAKILCSMFQLPVEQGTEPSFSDVTSMDWGLHYIEAVHRSGLMSGDGMTFRPNDLITREEMAVVLVRGFGFDSKGKGDKLATADKNLISPWAQDAVQTVLELGLMQASGNTFSPEQSLNRQELATIAVAVIDRPTGKVQVADGILTVAGITYQVPSSLQGLLSTANAGILQHAKFELERDGYKITGIKRLELQQEGVLDANNTTFNGSLILTASTTLKNLTVTGNVQLTGREHAATEFILENTTAASVEAKDAQLTARGTTQLADAVVKGNAAITVEGNASLDQLQVAEGAGDVQLKGKLKSVILLGNSQAKIVLQNGASMQNLTLPTGKTAREYFNQYDAIKWNIPMVNGRTNPDLIVSKPSPLSVNRTALNAKIQQATAVKNAAQVGTTPNTYPQAAYDDFVKAIANANAVQSNTQSTQQQVNAAATTLQQAIETFQNSLLVDTVNKSTLSNKINEATTLKNAAEPGTTPGKYPQEAIDALAQAFADAETVLLDQMVTQQQVNTATTALSQAIDTFNASCVQDKVNKTAFLAKIAEATQLRASAPIGDTTDNYPQSAANALTGAIDTAQLVADNDQATQAEVDTAITQLSQAIDTFIKSIVAPFTFELNQDVRFDMNSNGAGTSADVEITDMAAGPYQYNKRNITQLMKIKRGTQVETIRYKGGTNSFEVVNPTNNVTVAEIAVETSDANLLVVNPAAYGVNVHPDDSVKETTQATLVFKLKEAGLDVDHKVIPITFDETAPLLTSGNYSAQHFTLTASETIMFAGDVPITVQVEFSSKGDFTDTVPLTNQIDYLVNQPVGDQLTIDLTADGMQKCPVAQGSKFRIKASGYVDYAKNPMGIDSEQTITVDQY